MIGRALPSCIRVVLIESSGVEGGGRVIFRCIHRKCTEAMGPKRRAFLLPVCLFSAHNVGETLGTGRGREGGLLGGHTVRVTRTVHIYRKLCICAVGCDGGRGYALLPKRPMGILFCFAVFCSNPYIGGGGGLL